MTNPNITRELEWAQGHIGCNADLPECRLARALLALHAALEAERGKVARLHEAAKTVVADILDYERVNNLAPNPGRKYCWDSVERLDAALSEEPKHE